MAGCRCAAAFPPSPTQPHCLCSQTRAVGAGSSWRGGCHRTVEFPCCGPLPIRVSRPLDGQRGHREAVRAHPEVKLVACRPSRSPPAPGGRASTHGRWSCGRAARRVGNRRVRVYRLSQDRCQGAGAMRGAWDFRQCRDGREGRSDRAFGLQSTAHRRGDYPLGPIERGPSVCCPRDCLC